MCSYELIGASCSPKYPIVHMVVYNMSTCNNVLIQGVLKMVYLIQGVLIYVYSYKLTNNEINKVSVYQGWVVAK